MITFLTLLPGFLALFLVFLFKRQIDLATQAEQNQLNEVQSTLRKLESLERHLKKTETELNNLKTDLATSILQRIEKNAATIQKHQQFMENLTAASSRDREPDKKPTNAILDMIREGRPTLEIAREFGIPMGEVELMKNLNQFKT